MNSAPQDVLVHAERLTKTHGNGASGATASTASTSPCAAARLRLPGPQRRREVDHHAHDLLCLPAHRRHSAGPRHGRSATAPASAPASGGSSPQADTLDQELTVLENLLIYGRYFGLGKREARLKAAELLDFAQLQDKADAKSPLSPAACDGG